MASIIRKTDVKPIPAGAEVFTRKGRRFARWIDSRRRSRTAPLSEDGSKILVERPGWYIVYFDATGKRVTVTGYRDKEATETLARKLERDVERSRMGLPVSDANQARTPYTQVLEEWIAHLEHNGSDDEYVKNMRRLVTKLAQGCGWSTMASIRSDSVQAWLIDIKRHGVLDVKGQRKPKLPSDRTIDQYLGVAKQFVNYAIPRYLSENPLDLLENIKRPIKVRKRRAISEQELARLLEASGVRRSLYMVAALTGLRKDEIRQLEWRDVRLGGSKPFLQLRSEANKARREDRIPLAPAVVEEFRSLWREGASLIDRVFRGVPTQQTWRRDLKRAGIAYVDSGGRQFDFHSLRYVFCTFLARANVPIRTAMELMRHRDPNLTLQIYCDSGQLETDEAVARLPTLSQYRG